METIYLPHLSTYPIYAGLFDDVQNASFLREQLLQGNTDFEYALLDASMVCFFKHVDVVSANDYRYCLESMHLLLVIVQLVTCPTIV